MTKELKMVVGVALLVTLALAGALGIFTFSAASARSELRRRPSGQSHLLLDATVATGEKP